jgi:hypothetical protein
VTPEVSIRERSDCCRIARHSVASPRENPEWLFGLAARPLQRQADIRKKMVVSIGQFGERTSLAAAFDPHGNCH